MLGKTHFVLGMASALVITRPQTVPGVITAMTAGAIGGWIVDFDMRNRNNDEQSEEARLENVYDAVIDGLFIVAFILLDFFIGKGMCQYVIENWGVRTWGSLIGLLILLIFGLYSKHRTFTHSFLALALFSGLVYLFCRPATIPFAIGYASHLISDLFNYLGLQLFYPLKWRPCLKVCKSDKTTNHILFWISLVIDVLFGAFLFASGMNGIDQSSSNFISYITEKRLFEVSFHFNFVQAYLIFVNILTFLGFQANQYQYQVDQGNAYYRGVEYDEDDYETPGTRFQTWLLNLFTFLGGGIGMLVSLVISRERPAGYSGIWWSFCYTSILFWFTIYCYLCNPFGFEIGRVQWLSTKHLPLLLYLIGINAISVLFLFLIRKRRFNDYDLKHTVVFMFGALGGTLGAIPTVFLINREGKYYYVIAGFSIMMISQIVFIMYMMAAGVF